MPNEDEPSGIGVCRLCSNLAAGQDELLPCYRRFPSLEGLVRASSDSRSIRRIVNSAFRMRQRACSVV